MGETKSDQSPTLSDVAAMDIIEACIEILRERAAPLSAFEIGQRISERGLADLEVSDPTQAVEAAIRLHLRNDAGSPLREVGNSRFLFEAPAHDLTISYYSDHASEYAAQTKDAELSHLWDVVAKRLAPGSQVLDLGCGAGRDILALRARGLRPLGLDLCYPLLRIAKSLTACPLILADLRTIPLRPRSISAVWAIASLLHVSRADIAATLTGVLDVLTPGGLFFSSMKEGQGERRDSTGRFFAYYMLTEWTSILKDCGFDIQMVRSEREERWSGNGEDLSVNWIITAAQKSSRS